MVEQAEKLWTYEAVEPGQYGTETVVAITAGNIAGYAQVALNDDPRYTGRECDAGDADYGTGLRAAAARGNRRGQRVCRAGAVPYGAASDTLRQVRDTLAPARLRRRHHHRHPRRAGEVRAAGQPLRDLPRRRHQPVGRDGGGVRLHLHLRVRRGPAGGAGETPSP